MIVTFRVPTRTRYSPPNVEQLQRTFQKRTNALIRLMQSIVANDRSIQHAPSTTVTNDLLKAINRQDIPLVHRGHLRAYGCLLSELEILRRRIQSHPINFVPLEILVLVFSYVAGNGGWLGSDGRFDLVQVSRSWEAIVLTTPTLWSHFYVDRTEVESLDIALLLSQRAPLALSGTWRTLKPLRSLLGTDRVISLVDFYIVGNTSSPDHSDIIKKYGEDLANIPPLIETVNIYKPLELKIPCSISFTDFVHVSELTISAEEDLKPIFEHQGLTMPNLRRLGIAYYYASELVSALSAPLLTTLLFHGHHLEDLQRWLLFFASSFPTLENLNVVEDYRPLGLLQWSSRVPSNELPIKSFQAKEIDYEAFDLTSSESLPSPLQSLHPQLHIYTFAAVNLSMHFRRLQLRLKQKDFPTLNEFGFPYLISLSITSRYSLAIARFLRVLVAPLLVELNLYDWRGSDNQVDIYPIASVELIVIPPRGSNFTLKGEWPNLLYANIPLLSLDWKQDTPQFPQIRTLTVSLLQPPSFLFPHNWSHAGVINLSTLRQLKLPIPLFEQCFSSLTVLEEISFNNRRSNREIGTLVQALVDNFRLCPSLRTIISVLPPVNWEGFCKIVTLRAQAWMLEGSVSRITFIRFENAPRSSYLEALQAAMRGEPVLGDYDPFVCEDCRVSSEDLVCNHVFEGEGVDIRID